jgi:hypothetical protein
MQPRARYVARAITLLVALAAASGCTVKLIADYDPVLDQGVAELATNVDVFLSKMERTAGTPQGAYSANAAFYADAAATVRTLRLKAESQPKNQKMVEALDLLSKSLEDVRGRHEAHGDSGLGPAFVGPARAGFETQFRALFMIESTLRTRGS